MKKSSLTSCLGQ